MATPEFTRPPDFTAFLVFCATCPLAHFAFGLFATPQATFLSEILFLLVPALLFLRLYPAPGMFSPRFGSTQTMATLATATTLSLGLNFALPHWLEFFPMPKAFERSFLDLLHVGSPSGFILDLALLGLVPAVSEELFFRGVVQMGLGGRFKPRAATLIAAAYFAAIHLNPWYFPFYFVLGIFFGIVFVKTRRLGLSISAHFVNNALGVTLYHYF